MDIFTTQLTRVVPVPIKPANLKVKALLKEAANSKLSQDPDHIENHECYFTTEEDQYHSSRQGGEQEQHAKQKEEHKNQTDSIKNDVASEQDEKEINVEKSDNGNNDDTKHLDLYA
ncbi:MULTISPECIES: hypothetical protein [Colwellia]|uniref:Uncharacterized protein n=1 Tax=Colwellia psychrerythraea (strain 34H / ATCC BAA-681) TaxID=167879 RepID=Q47XC1_COLP3|nr:MULTISPECIES: hypothetical protein [Colwellia]AAZ25360.1 hypothetical protein CPS_3887 [Colwellia psychrerythraea 34H]PKH86516.1 hypothetical protein CXF79_07075 [Colwellia sp. Bg11-28]